MKIAVIGTGNMGSAVATHLGQKHSLVLCNRDEEKGQALALKLGAEFVQDPKEASARAQWIVLAVKPKDLQSVAKQMPLTEEHTLLSVLGGVSLEAQMQAFPKTRVIRLMPNTAITTGKGIIGLSAQEDLSLEDKEKVTELFSEVGRLFWLSDSMMNAFAAFAASSPAFVFVMMEAMIESGIYLGFQAQEATEIVTGVFEGAAALIEASGKHPATLKQQISSPGGTTIAGLYALESANVRKPIFDAMVATVERGH